MPAFPCAPLQAIGSTYLCTMSWLFLALVISTLSSALCAEQQRVVRQLIMPGELPVATSSSSYNYWWPYPPAGTTSTPTPIEYTPPVPELAVTDTSPILPFALPTDSNVGLLSATIPTMPLSATSSTSSTNSTSSPSSDSSLPSIITITATSLTEVPTLVTYPKKNPETQSPRLIYYLVPVFAIVGIIVGSVCAWIVCGCWTRKPRTKRRKQDELEVGPAYSPRDWKRKEATSLRDESKWDSPLTPPVLPEKEHDSWNDVETASFLALPKTRSRTKTTHTSRKPISRAQTTKTSRTMSVYSQVDEDEHTDDDLEFLNDYESDIDDEHQVGKARTRRRHAHERQNSDYAATVSREKSNASSSTWGWAALNSNLGREKSVGEKSLGGFRIMQESPLPSPTTNKVFGWAKEEDQDDTYTEIPPRGRRSRSPSKVRTRSSPVKRAGAISKSSERKAPGTSKKPFRNADAYPFGQSPRQITSPKLEGKLCFTPRIGQEETQFQSMLNLDDVEPLKL